MTEIKKEERKEESKTLLQLNEELESIYKQMSEHQFDESEEFEMLQREWDETLGDRKEKISRYCYVYKSLIDQGNAIKARATENMDRAKSLIRKAENIEKFLYMQMAEREKFETPDHQIKWRESTSLRVTESSMIPNVFLLEQEPKVDKSGIKAWMKKKKITETPFAVLDKKVNMNIK